MHEVPLFAKNRYESVVPWKECDSKDRPPSEIAICPRVGCGKRYGSSDSLKQHLRTHKNEIRLPDGRRKPAASTAAVTASTSVMADKSSKDKPVEMFTDFAHGRLPELNRFLWSPSRGASSRHFPVPALADTCLFLTHDLHVKKRNAHQLARMQPGIADSPNHVTQR